MNALKKKPEKKGMEEKLSQRELNGLKDTSRKIEIYPVDPLESKSCASAVLYPETHSKNRISAGEVNVIFNGTDEKGNALFDIFRRDKILKSNVAVSEGSTVTTDIEEKGLSIKISAREITSSSAMVDVEVKAGYPTKCGCEPLL